VSDSSVILLTAVVAVKNEASNIRDCLQSISFADQIFVVDSHSTDGTAEIAEKLGATVVQFDYDGTWPKKRNWALRHLPIKNEWVLVLDGDERVDATLRDEICEVIHKGDFDAYYMRWKFVFLGRWMKHCWSHGWMLRLFKHGKAEYEDLGLRGEGGWDAEVHENLVLLDGQAGKLKSWLTHDTNQDLSYWIKKQNDFSSWNAVRRQQLLAQPLPAVKSLFTRDPVLIRKWMKGVFIRLPFRAFLLFIWLYFCKRGFLDGRAGYYFCWLRAIHEFNISAKVFERRVARQELESRGCR
jgi:glycosyltransferase involved in cell wall biosynthesis